MRFRSIAWLPAFALAVPAIAQVGREVPVVRAQPRPVVPVIRPPIRIPGTRIPPASPVPTASLVHFDLTCRDVTGLGAGWGGSLSFICVRPDGQSEQLRIALMVDYTGQHIGENAVQNSEFGLLNSLIQAATARHFEATTNANISQVVQAFMLYRAAHAASPAQMVVHGIESLDPSNLGDRVVIAAYFSN